MPRLVTTIVCALGSVFVLGAAPPLGAQGVGGWDLALGAGTASSSNPPSRFASGLGSAASAQLAYSIAPHLAIRGEGFWTALPARALGAPPPIAYPMALACVYPGCTYIPQRPVHGHLGVAGASASMVVSFPLAHGAREYLLAGGGAYRDYTVPHTDDGWSPGPVLTTSALELGYGMHFGSNERFGLELRAHHFAAGAVRWLFPVTLTLRL